MLRSVRSIVISATHYIHRPGHNINRAAAITATNPAKLGSYTRSLLPRPATGFAVIKLGEADAVGVKVPLAAAVALTPIDALGVVLFADDEVPLVHMLARVCWTTVIWSANLISRLKGAVEVLELSALSSHCSLTLLPP